eukprot:GHVQ01025251.1.p1 GENE.GHVQ01025251.1~~GHVQ01025251.1.p1  ORF type:complete len:1272 (+),score=213.52 GHVQ01025251.1:623-4438(+)
MSSLPQTPSAPNSSPPHPPEMDLADRFEKLRSKYRTLKEQNSVLKEALKSKQAEALAACEATTEQKAREERLVEELSAVQQQHDLICKQAAQLNAQLEDMRTQKTGGGSWGGALALLGGASKEAVEKMQEELKVLRDELEMKIRENEELHMTNFVVKQDNEVEAARVLAEESASQQRIQNLECAVKEHQVVAEATTCELQSQTKLKARAERKHKDIEIQMHSLAQGYEAEERLYADRVRRLQSKVLFDDHRIELWDSYNLTSGGTCQLRFQQLRLSRDVGNSVCAYLANYMKLIYNWRLTLTEPAQLSTQQPHTSPYSIHPHGYVGGSSSSGEAYRPVADVSGSEGEVAGNAARLQVLSGLDKKMQSLAHRSSLCADFLMSAVQRLLLCVHKTLRSQAPPPLSTSIQHTPSSLPLRHPHQVHPVFPDNDLNSKKDACEDAKSTHEPTDTRQTEVSPSKHAGRKALNTKQEPQLLEASLSPQGQNLSQPLGVGSAEGALFDDGDVSEVESSGTEISSGWDSCETESDEQGQHDGGDPGATAGGGEEPLVKNREGRNWCSTREGKDVKKVWKRWVKRWKAEQKAGEDGLGADLQAVEHQTIYTYARRCEKWQRRFFMFQLLTFSLDEVAFGQSTHAGLASHGSIDARRSTRVLMNCLKEVRRCTAMIVNYFATLTAYNSRYPVPCLHFSLARTQIEPITHLHLSPTTQPVPCTLLSGSVPHTHAGTPTQPARQMHPPRPATHRPADVSEGGVVTGVVEGAGGFAGGGDGVCGGQSMMGVSVGSRVGAGSLEGVLGVAGKGSPYWSCWQVEKLDQCTGGGGRGGKAEICDRRKAAEAGLGEEKELDQANLVVKFMVNRIAKTVTHLAACCEAMGRCVSARMCLPREIGGVRRPLAGGGNRVVAVVSTAGKLPEHMAVEETLKTLGELLFINLCTARGAILQSAPMQQRLGSCRGFMRCIASQLERAPGRISWQANEFDRLRLKEAVNDCKRLRRERREIETEMRRCEDQRDECQLQVRDLRKECDRLEVNYEILRCSGTVRADAGDAAEAAQMPPKPPPLGHALSAIERRRTAAATEPTGVSQATTEQNGLGQADGVRWDGLAHVDKTGLVVDVPCDGRYATDRSETVDGDSLKTLYIHHLRQLQQQLKIAGSANSEGHEDLITCLRHLREGESHRQALQEVLDATLQKVEDTKADMNTTKMNYDSQIAMLTEHICELSETLTEKDGRLAAVQANKVRCGRCGVWNTIGYLCGGASNGSCTACRGLVLDTLGQT